jgi:hypothetical protein
MSAGDFLVRQFWLPVRLACLDIFSVQRHGEIDPQTRCCVFNQTSLLDPKLNELASSREPAMV